MAKQQYTVVAVNDKHHTCGHCGKTGLKRVVWLMPVDAQGNDLADEAAPYGTTCAARALAPDRHGISLAQAEAIVTQAQQDHMVQTIEKARDLALALGILAIVDNTPHLADLVAPSGKFLHHGKIMQAHGIDPDSGQGLGMTDKAAALVTRNGRLPWLNSEMMISDRFPMAQAWLAQQAAAQA